jgi:NADPH-dependent 2,4-dienoyl-CoA reductase/sulfur reductase-like enzyme
MRLLVVGGVAAGLSAASRARRLDPALDIVVLEKGSRISYGACGLPYYIEGQVRSLDELTVYTPDFFRHQRRIEVRTGAEVAAIRHAAREVVLASGERLHYDRLVWAAGARAARGDGRKVFPFHTADDAARLAERLRAGSARRAAVVGGGYIGLEMAGALRARGVAVTLYHDKGDLLDRGDPALTKTLLARLSRARVEVRLNCPVSDPAGLEADIVLLAAGVKPNVEVPAEAGVELGRSGAIRASEWTETNLAAVFAAGDCAETIHLVTGAPVWIPLGTTANKMGRVAGANAAGRRERFAGVTGTSIVRVCGLGVACTGLSEAQARQAGFSPLAASVEALDRARYFRGRKVAVSLIADRANGRLLGATITGDEGAIGRVNVCATALAARLTVEQFASLDLAYAPPYAPVMDPLLVAAQQLLKQL